MCPWGRGSPPVRQATAQLGFPGRGGTSSGGITGNSAQARPRVGNSAWAQPPVLDEHPQNAQAVGSPAENGGRGGDEHWGAAERPPCPADGSADCVWPPVPRASRPPCALTPDAPGPPPSTRAAPFRGTGTASGGKCRRGHRLLTRKATSQLEDRRDSQHVRNTPPRRRRPRSSTDAEHAPPPRPRDAAEARVPVTRASAPGTCRRGQQSCSAATTAHASSPASRRPWAHGERPCRDTCAQDFAAQCTRGRHARARTHTQHACPLSKVRRDVVEAAAPDRRARGNVLLVTGYVTNREPPGPENCPENGAPGFSP